MNEAANRVDAMAESAERIRITARLESPATAFEVQLTPSAIWWRAGSTSPTGGVLYDIGGQAACLADVLQEVGKLGGRLRPETIEVKTTRCSVPGKEVKPLVVEALCGGLGVAVPDSVTLATLRKLFQQEQQQERDTRAAAKAKNAQREQARAQQQRARRQQPDEPVRDVGSFLKAVEVRVRDRGRLQKALSMLRAQRFHLYSDSDSDQVIGVVKSQNDPSLVYGCRLAQDGSFSCCTQNLNTCGGLRGQLCKHILVMVIGLVQAEELAPGEADAWIARSLDCKQSLDRDAMAEVFLRYKGAEAGDVDWRPTETIPEDFYAYG